MVGARWSVAIPSCAGGVWVAYLLLSLYNGVVSPQAIAVGAAGIAAFVLALFLATRKKSP